MNKYFVTIVCLTSIILGACSPSQQSITTAIAQTQVIQTTIEAGISQTQTASAPTATSTSLPTDTPLPITNTPKPLSKLSDIVVQHEDINDLLPDLYSSNYIEVKDKGLKIDVSLETYSRLYIAKGVDANIFIQIYRLQNRDVAVGVSATVRKEYLKDSELLSVPSSVQLDGDAWMVKTQDKLLLGFHQSNLFVAIFFDLLPELEIDTAATVLALLGQVQQRHISDGGW